MKKVIPDPNIFLRLLLNDIPSQNRQAKSLLTKAKNNELEILMPSIVIFEINFALEKYYGFGKKEVIDKISTIVSTKYIYIQSRKTFIKALDVYKEKNISLVDSFLLAKAEHEEAELFSFDKKLRRS